jgi:hypothetical protein
MQSNRPTVMARDLKSTKWITTMEAAASGYRGGCSDWMVEEISNSMAQEAAQTDSLYSQVSLPVR